MKKKMKWITLSLLTTGLVGVSAAGVLMPKNAAAEATEATETPTIQGVDISSFVMEKGAGVRVNGDGLRFSAEMSATTYNELKAKGATFGMLIVPESYLTEGYELTEENVFVNNKFYFEEENPNDGRRGMINLSTKSLYNKDADENVEIYGAMTGIGTANIYREFVGVAYVQVPSAFDETTGEATAYDYKFAPYFDGDIANNTRSMYYTAQRTLELTDWEGDMEAVEANYITAYDAYIADYGYTFGYTESHVLTKLDGTQKTLTEEIKYGDLNSTVAAEYYNDPALYSMYYCTDSEMPSSKLYANGHTTLTVNYKEVEVDLENLIWNKELTEANHGALLYVTEWGAAMTEEPFSVTTTIPEGGVAGSYLYYSGAADKAREDIQVQLDPAYSKGYYQALLNTGLPFVVKYDVYVENCDSTYTGTSVGLKSWNGTSSFNASAGAKVTIGQWKTVTFDLDYLVNNWGNYRIFGLELQSYSDANQKVNFYLGNIRIEEKPKVWREITATSGMRAYSGGAGTSATNKAAGSAKFTVVTSATSETDAAVLGDRTGNYFKYSQGQGWGTMSWRIMPTYSIEYYQLLLNSDKTFKIYFDVYFKGDGSVAPYKWVNGSLTSQGNKTEDTWYTYSCTLAELIKDWTATTAGQTYGPRLFAITGMNSSQSPKTYIWIGNIRLVEETA